MATFLHRSRKASLYIHRPQEISTYIHTSWETPTYIHRHLETSTVSAYICLHLFKKGEDWRDKQEIKDDYIVEAEGSGWEEVGVEARFPNVPTFEMYYLFK